MYTWQDALGKRELIWSCEGNQKEQKDDLVKVKQHYNISVNKLPISESNCHLQANLSTYHLLAGPGPYSYVYGQNRGWAETQTLK